MKEKIIINSIRASSKILEDIKILQSFINPGLLKVNKKFNTIILNEESSYEEIFLSGLENNYYNFILKDYSYFQFNYLEKEDYENSFNNPYSRFAYYPNPFDNIDDDLQDIYGAYNDGSLDFEDYTQALSEAKPNAKKIPIRYDLSCKQFKKIYHPTAHFHFGISENSRISTDRVFTPELFTIFILNMYYCSNVETYSNGDFLLENRYKRLLNKSIKVSDFNNSSEEYFCSLQTALINIR